MNYIQEDVLSFDAVDADLAGKPIGLSDMNSLLSQPPTKEKSLVKFTACEGLTSTGNGIFGLLKEIKFFFKSIIFIKMAKIFKSTVTKIRQEPIEKYHV